jgi:hypothetical protein
MTTDDFDEIIDSQKNKKNKQIDFFEGDEKLFIVDESNERSRERK